MSHNILTKKHRKIAKSCPEKFHQVWKCQVVLLKNVTITIVTTVTITTVLSCVIIWVCHPKNIAKSREAALNTLHWCQYYQYYYRHNLIFLVLGLKFCQILVLVVTIKKLPYHKFCIDFCQFKKFVIGLSFNLNFCHILTL